MTKTLRELFEPKAKGELKFFKKHVVKVTPDANGNGEDVFDASKVKVYDRAKDRMGVDPSVTVEGRSLTELSKKTLGSYVRKAATSAADNSGAAHRAHAAGHRAIADTHSDNVEKRLTGVGRATKRLTKESLEESTGKAAAKKPPPVKQNFLVHDSSGKVVAKHALKSQAIKGAREGNRDYWLDHKHRAELRVCTSDEHLKKFPTVVEGKFARLDHELAHEKGVSNPAALAAAIGRKKLGARKFEAKAHAHEEVDLSEDASDTKSRVWACTVGYTKGGVPASVTKKIPGGLGGSMSPKDAYEHVKGTPDHKKMEKDGYKLEHVTIKPVEGSPEVSKGQTRPKAKGARK